MACRLSRENVSFIGITRTQLKTTHKSFLLFSFVWWKGRALTKRITAFHGCHSAGQSNLGIQTVLCCGVLTTCSLPMLGVRPLAFLKEFLKFQKMKRDKGENKKPGFFFFFKFPTALVWCSQDQGGQPESSICCIHLHHWCHCDNRPVRAERVRQKCAHTTLKPSQERRFSPHWLGANPKEPLSSRAWTQPKPGPRTLTPTHMLDHLGFLP